MLARFVTGKEVGPGSALPVLTGRKMTRLSVAGLHVCRLPQLQALTPAGWPNGTDDLAPPSARAAALGALGPVGGSGKRKRTCIGREALTVGVGWGSGTTREGGREVGGREGGKREEGAW